MKRLSKHSAVNSNGVRGVNIIKGNAPAHTNTPTDRQLAGVILHLPLGRIELTTPGLQDQCSAAELKRLKFQFYTCLTNNSQVAKGLRCVA